MKKNLLNWMTILLMTFVCVGFAACGGGDDDSDGGISGGSHTTSDGQSAGTFQGAKRVFGENLVKAVSSSEGDRWEFTYDAKGYLIKAKLPDSYRTNDYELSYSKNKVIVNRYQSGNLRSTITGTIGSNGFLTKTVEEEDEIVEFTYDKDGHMTRWTLYDDGELDDDVYMKWDNGDVVSGESKDDRRPDVYSVMYEQNGVGPFVNTTGLADIGDMTAIKWDHEAIFIYGGFLGVSPAHLPVVSTSVGEDVEDGEKETHTVQCTWEFDNQNRATRLVKKTVNTIKGNYTYERTKTYTWEY